MKIKLVREINNRNEKLELGTKFYKLYFRY